MIYDQSERPLTATILLETSPIPQPIRAIEAKETKKNQLHLTWTDPNPLGSVSVYIIQRTVNQNATSIAWTKNKEITLTITDLSYEHTFRIHHSQLPFKPHSLRVQDIAPTTPMKLTTRNINEDSYVKLDITNSFGFSFDSMQISLQTMDETRTIQTRLPKQRPLEPGTYSLSKETWIPVK